MVTILQLLTVLLVVSIQVTVFGHWRPLGVMPNLMLILMVYVALWSVASRALAVAVVGGLLLDLSSSSDFGLRTAFYVLICLIVIAARQFGLHSDSIFSAVMLVFLGTIAFNLAIVSTLTGIQTDWSYVIGLVGWEIVINCSLVLAIFAVRILLSDRRSRVEAELRRKSWL